MTSSAICGKIINITYFYFFLKSPKIGPASKSSGGLSTLFRLAALISCRKLPCFGQALSLRGHFLLSKFRILYTL